VPHLADVAERLIAASSRHHSDASRRIDWPDRVDRHCWYTSPELISLCGTREWAGLEEPQRMLLSFWEAVNFFSLNLHGERVLTEGLARFRRTAMRPIREYMTHFSDEEDEHSSWFTTFCTRYADGPYHDRSVVFPRAYQPGEEEFVFFVRVLIFEEIADAFNAAMARDARLEPVARQINALHHADESRHLAFGRRMVGELWERLRPTWNVVTVANLRSEISAYIDHVWRAYYNPAVYRDAGLANTAELARAAWACDHAIALRARFSERCMRRLVGAGVLDLVEA
jgi:hypothetical protein